MEVLEGCKVERGVPGGLGGMMLLLLLFLHGEEGRTAAGMHHGARRQASQKFQRRLLSLSPSR